MQQTHTVNTYVSRRSSLHSNPQHSNSHFLRSASSKVGCFHGNQAAAFDDGSHERTPTDNTSSSSFLGWMDGWMTMGGLQREIVEKEKVRKRKAFIFPQKLSHVTTSLLASFPSCSGLPGAKADGEML